MRSNKLQMAAYTYVTALFSVAFPAAFPFSTVQSLQNGEINPMINEASSLSMPYYKEQPTTSNPALNFIIPDFRPPAVPLIVLSPEISVWSFADNSYDTHTTHWSGIPMNFSISAAINGTIYNVVGNDNPYATDNMRQTSVSVLPTTTIYTYNNLANLVELTIEFTTPTFLKQPSENNGFPYTFHQ
jgi:hypothetical protein